MYVFHILVAGIHLAHGERGIAHGVAFLRRHEGVCHLVAQLGAQVAAHLALVAIAGAWIVVQRAPDAHVPALGHGHQAVDDFSALGVVVKVVHKVAQAVYDDDVGRVLLHPVSHHLSPLFGHVSAVGHRAKPDDVKAGMVHVCTPPAQPVHPALQHLRVHRLHLRVNVQHHGHVPQRLYRVLSQPQAGQLGAHPLAVRLQGARHQHGHEERLAVFLLPADGLYAAERRKGHAVILKQKQRGGILPLSVEHKLPVVVAARGRLPHKFFLLAHVSMLS